MFPILQFNNDILNYLVLLTCAEEEEIALLTAFALSRTVTTVCGTFTKQFFSCINLISAGKGAIVPRLSRNSVQVRSHASNVRRSAAKFGCKKHIVLPLHTLVVGG